MRLKENYTLENLYNNYGQYNATCLIEFWPESEAFQKFGCYIVGELKYSPKDRETLENKRLEGFNDETVGVVKIRLLEPKASEERILEARKVGFKSSDIMVVKSYIKPDAINQYSNQSTRQLPEPFQIHTSLTNSESLLLENGVYESQLRHGYQFTPIEKLRYVAIKQILEEPPMESIEKEVDKTSSEYQFFVSQIKFETELLKDEELDSFLKQKSDRAAEKVLNLKTEIARSGKSLSELLELEQARAFLTSAALFFEEERLLHRKGLPVFLSFERYVHIALGHFHELQSGSYHLGKTPFQFKGKDVLKLIEIVFQKIEKEVDCHFNKNPGSPFNRVGAMAVEFQGDYYDIRVASNGELQSFYKRSKNYNC